MLEGLEISEIRNNSLERTLRLDAEFYSKFNLGQQKLFNDIGAQSLSNFATISDGNHMSISDNFVDDGVPYYRGGDIYNVFIETTPSPLRIPKPIFDMPTMQRSHLQKGDVLMSIVGAIIGNVSLVTTNNPATCSCKLAIIRPNQNEILPEYLGMYLMSKFGQQQIQKFRRGSGQTGLILEDFDQLLIPKVSKNLQEKIAGIVNSSYESYIKSQSMYDSAEQYLLECLGLTDFAINPDAYNVKSFKDSFIASGRFDAEYYLPKYEDYANLIRQYDGGADTIGNICEVKDRNFNPETDKEYRYIELANVGNHGEITGCSTMSGSELPSRARRIVHTGDVVISSLEGSIDSCALIPQEYDCALCSTGFYVMKSDKLNPETLLTLFKSLPIQQLMIRGCSGAIMSTISRVELDSIPLPLIHQEVQDEIAKHVQKSFTLRLQAKNMLDEAKLTVENAILLGGGKWLIYNGLQNLANTEYRIAMMLLLDNINYPYCHTTPKRGVAHKSLSSSFAKSGRMDAEYYQPKYDRLSTYLNGFPCSSLGELTSIQKSVEPGSDAYQDNGIPFVRVQDLTKFGITETDVHLSENDYPTVIRPKKDTILLSKDGSVGIAYKVEEDINCITSGAILHLTVKDCNVLPDYLTLVLNSIIVKMQAERDAGGSIIQHWKPSEIETVKVPILPKTIQKELSNKVQLCFALRKESEQLLQDAKSLVENVIYNNRY